MTAHLTINLITHIGKNKKYIYHFVKKSAIECAKFYALFIFILNIISPGLGKFISSASDRRGCNCWAVLIAFL